MPAAVSLAAEEEGRILTADPFVAWFVPSLSVPSPQSLCFVSLEEHDDGTPPPPVCRFVPTPSALVMRCARVPFAFFCALKTFFSLSLSLVCVSVCLSLCSSLPSKTLKSLARAKAHRPPPTGARRHRYRDRRPAAARRAAAPRGGDAHRGGEIASGGRGGGGARVRRPRGAQRDPRRVSHRDRGIFGR